MNCLTRKLVLVVLILVAGLGASTAAWAAPNVVIIDVQPRLFAAAVAAPLAAPTQGGDESFEISLDVYVRNDELVPVNLAQVDFAFGVGVSPSAVQLTDTIHMSCSGGKTLPLTENSEIRAGEECKILLIDDPRITPFVPEFIDLWFFFENYSPLVQTVPIVNYANAQPKGSFFFFGKADDLAPGEFWSTRYSGTVSGHRKAATDRYAYDAGIARYDADTSTWVDKHPLSQGEIENGDENEDYLVWGKPIYAMADGIVSNCSDGAEDNIPGDKTHPANFVEIDHGPEFARYTHLKKNTINPALCVPGALVTAGDYLGEVGNSGNSTHPHFHIEVRRNGQGVPILFKDIFIVDRAGFSPDSVETNADWSFVRERSLPWEKLAIWPAPMVRRGTETAGRGDGIDLLDLSSDTKITAMRSAQSKLDLRAWGKIGNGDMTETDQETGETIRQVALAKPSVTPFFVSAILTSNNQIKLTEWDQFLNEGPSAFGGGASDLAITTSPHMPGLVTASRNNAGNLRVMGWDYIGGISIDMGDVVDGVAVSQVSIATGSGFEGVVTASRTAGGNLSLSSWSVNPDESVINLIDTFNHVAIKDVEIAFIGQVGASDRMVTAARGPLNHLILTTWNIASNGVITQLDEVVGDRALDASVADGGEDHVLTAVRDHVSGYFEMIAWEIDNAGLIERRGTVPGEEIREVAVGKAMFVNPTTRQQAVTAVRDHRNYLKVISWEVGLEQ